MHKKGMPISGALVHCCEMTCQREAPIFTVVSGIGTKVTNCASSRLDG